MRLSFSAFVTIGLLASFTGSGCSRQPDALPGSASIPKNTNKAAQTVASRTTYGQGRTNSGSDQTTTAARSGTPHHSNVILPQLASAAFSVSDIESGISIDVSLVGADAVPADSSNGDVIYRAAYKHSADVLQRVSDEGTEDHVRFDNAPDRPVLEYLVELGAKVKGLRLVSNSLEFLDAAGAPRLRVRPPRVVDAAGVWHDAALTVDGCAFDSLPTPPWGRKVVAPSASSCTVRVTWEKVPYPATVDPAWVSTGNMVNARYQHTATLLPDGRVLAAGGQDTCGCVLNSAELYDPTTGTWAMTGSMAVQRTQHVAALVTVGGTPKVIVGGGGLPAVASSELYNTATGTWSTGGTMKAARRDATATVLPNGTVLVVAGQNASETSLKTAEIYTPSTNTWALTTSMTDARCDHTASLVTANGLNEVVVVGGEGNTVPFLTSVEVFHISTATWTKIASLATGRIDHAAWVLNNGNVLVAGGTSNYAANASAELLNTSTQTWSSAGSLSHPRSWLGAALLGSGAATAIGGVDDSGDVSTVDDYDPATNSWSAGPSLITARSMFTTTQLQSGVLLVAGGAAGTTAFSSAELSSSGAGLGASCTTNADCASGICSNSVCVSTCDDGNPCTTDTLGSTVCSHSNAADGTGCNDGNSCTQTDTCQAGSCVGSNPVVCTASDQCHVAGTCNPSTGQCSNPSAADGITCSDGNSCTQTDTCQSGACVGSNPVVCTASDQCHVAGSCDPATGQCSNPSAANGTACNDGNSCTQTDACQSGSCVGSNPVVCAASDQCHVAGTCDPSTGQCSNPIAANGAACNDGNSCTQTDTCQSGACVGSNPIVCTASDQCHVAGTCNPSTGQCSNPIAANGTTCSDGNSCTQTDTCQSGACVGGNPVVCSASDQCHVAGTCDPTTGQCSNPNAANGTACNDSNNCTQTDTCQSGACVGGNPVVCTASDQCHVAGTCDPSTGQCSNPAAAQGTTCTDSNLCDLNPVCDSAGHCAGTPKTCVASDQCHSAGTCDSTTGQCSDPTVADGTTCTSTGGPATCIAGTCTVTGPPCTALDQCHIAGTRDPITGVCSNPLAPNGTACDDGNACTSGETCQAGVCGQPTSLTRPSFAAMRQVSTQAPYYSKVALGDFNGDNIFDVIAPQGLLLGNGDGTFQVPRASVSGSADIAAVGDFNRDGKLDVAVEVSGGLSVALGNGDGTLQAPLPPLGTRLNSTFYVTAAADFNGDGKLDIAAVDRSENPMIVSILAGNGNGTFVHTVDYSVEAKAVTTADFNNDGKVDIVTTTNDNDVTVLLGNGDGTFGAVKTFAITNYFYGAAIDTADFNGDGKRDIVVNNSTGISVILGNGDGTFLAEHDYPTGGGATTSLTVADFNADGISDVAATHDSAVSVFFGKSDGTMLAAATFPIGISPGLVRAADFNRDGKPDILTGDVYNVGPSIALSAMPDACFACTNPIVPEGAHCNDGDVCTTGDTCQNHVCVGSDLTDGSSCSTRANASGTCSVGTCHDACNPGFADCGGVCTGIVGDNQNCGGCGVTCAAGTTCAGGQCVRQEFMQGCSTTSGVTVLVKGSAVTTYVANGSWEGPGSVYRGVQMIPLEGGGSQTAIATPNMVNTCAANSVTGEVVCVAGNSDKDVYTIEQSSLTSTLHSGATTSTGFTDGGGYNVGVAVDAATNRAVISLGLDNYGYAYSHGFQFLDLGTRTFEPPIPVHAQAAEQFVVDPVRGYVFSAAEDANFLLLNNRTDQPFVWHLGGSTSYFDSSAEDCQTGIVIGAIESSNQLVLADLTQASIGATTWSAPFATQPGARDAFTVAQGSHLGFGIAEGGAYFTVVRLPSTSGFGAPAVVDYASSHFTSFNSGLHTAGAYVSPSDGKAYAVVANAASDQIAIVDLQGILNAPRDPIASQDPAEGYTHDVTGDPATLGLVRFVSTLGHPDFVNPPTASANPVLTAAVQLSTLGRDPLGEASLSYSWSANGPNQQGGTPAGPSRPVSFSPNGTNAAKNSTATFAAPGFYALTATIADPRGFTTARQLNLNVGQAFATFSAAPATLELATGDTATITATGNDQFGTPYLGSGFHWSQVTGPTGGSATFANSSSYSTTVSFNTPGTYTIQASASDGYTPTHTATITATVVGTCSGGSCDLGVPDMGSSPDMSGPALVVNAGSNVTITLPIASVTLNGTVTDNNGQPPSGSVTTTWSKVSGPGTVVFADASSLKTTATLGAVGVYDLRLTATEPFASGTSDVTVTVNPQGTTQGPPPSCPIPTVAIASPSDGSELTTRTDVVGSVSAGNWTLQYILGGDESSTPPVTICSGTGPVYNAHLCTFDPTLLVNGTYSLRLTSACDSGSSATAVVAAVTRNQKVGVSRVSFNDVTVPVAGLPIKVTRTYDSRNKSTSGDFGFGWNIDLGSGVRVEKSAGLGKWWVQTKSDNPLFPQYCLNPSRALFVTVTFPAGKVYRFQVGQDQPCQTLYPISDGNLTFTPIAPTQGSLVALNGDAFTVSNDVGPVQLLDSNTLDPVNPTQFQLTTENGMVYLIDQHAGLLEVDDRNGNVLSISSSGITHSSSRSAAFVRDTQGRITSVVDPSGSFVSYTYDTGGNLATVKDRTGNVTTFEYDPDHSLVAIKDPRGIQDAAYVYDSDGRLISKTDANGNSAVYAHDLDALRDVTTDALGNVTTYEYDADGNVVKLTDARAGVTARTFDANDNKLTETDALGHTTTYAYDSSNNLIGTTDPFGKTVSSTYNSLQEALTTTDELGHTTTNTYDAHGNLLSTTDPLGHTTSYAYNSVGLQTSQTDARNGVTTFEYDSFGNLTKQTNALGYATTYTYDANGRRVTETRTRTLGTGTESLVTTYAYDPQGRRTKITYPDNTTTVTTYNAIGKKASTSDQLGRTTTYDYDALGNLSKTTYPDNTTELASYDASGRLSASTDRGGRTTSYSYDELGRVTKTTYPDGSSTASTYDALGRLLTSTDELGNLTSYTYDAIGRRTSATDALSHTTLYAYDDAGNRTSVTDPLGHSTTTTYDADNQAIRETYADGSVRTMQYDATGNKIAETDAGSATTNYVYNLVGQLVQVTDARGGSTTYGYDEVGNRIGQTDANSHTTVFAYDRLGHRTTRILPLGQTETWTYDSAGNIQSKTDANNRTTQYSYDSSNRLTSKTPDIFFDTKSISLTYTATGKLATVVDASGVTTYLYDQRDRMLSKTTPAGKLTYTYNAAGDRLTLRSDAADGVSVDYSWDPAHRLVSVTDGSAGGGNATYGYDAAGNLIAYSLPNGVAAALDHDVLNRLTNVAMTAGSNAIESYAYTYGPAGNRLSLSEGSGRTVSWSYDQLYRLTNETIAGGIGNGENGVVTYGYDATLNRSTKDSTMGAIASSTYACDADDRLSSATYDSEGNSTTSGSKVYSYDFENRLTNVNSDEVILGYDGQGMLTSRTANHATTNFLVDENGPTGVTQIVEERAGGTVTKAFVFGATLVSQRQKMNDSWTTSYYGYDGRGDVRMLFDNAGIVTDKYDYDAFGNLVYSTGSTPNDYRYSGERFDSGLGLVYLRARFMAPDTGRFLSPDSAQPELEVPATLSPYAYASADPIDNRDPLGLFTQKFGYQVEAAIAPLYRRDHNWQFVWFGKVLTPFGLLIKPDIVNFSQKTWEEIKPFTPSGVIRAAASSLLYNGKLKNWGFTPDDWAPLEPIEIPAGTGDPTWFFNADGILFYTDQEQVAEEAALIPVLTVEGAKALAKKLGPRLAARAASRGLFSEAASAIEQGNMAAIEGLEGEAELAADIGF